MWLYIHNQVENQNVVGDYMLIDEWILWRKLRCFSSRLKFSLFLLVVVLCMEIQETEGAETLPEFNCWKIFRH